MAKYIQINLGKYSIHEKLRDICSVMLFLSQVTSWIIYGTIWSLILPVLICGVLAAFFTVRSDKLYQQIWQEFRRGMMKGTVMLIAVSFAFTILAYWLHDSMGLKIAAIGLIDAVFVYSITISGWLIRDKM
jgi:cobalamin biosynthesis protein CobD/CbiB